MQYRRFGETDLTVSEIGFGGWAIGGPAMAGATPIGWGSSDDRVAMDAVHTALDQGINFFDTADFYGLGHSEKLLGRVLGNRDDALIATKVGHRLDPSGAIRLDYSPEWIIEACEASLRRLQREQIDFYQLHSARLPHLESQECLAAMDTLQEQGKIRFWGLSLNTYAPDPEGKFMIDGEYGDGFQVVLNVINQLALPIIRRAGREDFGIIARMPLQFGLLTGKFTPETRFPESDHRRSRLPPDILERALAALQPIWAMADSYGCSPAEFCLSYVLSYPEVCTVIPGIRTPRQAVANSEGVVTIAPEDRDAVEHLFAERYRDLLEANRLAEQR